jgi:T5SS/PEP-CTERM-associated repeat protein
METIVAAATAPEAARRASGSTPALSKGRPEQAGRLTAAAGLGVLAAALFAPGALALPCTVNQYNSCYVGVDGDSTPVTLTTPAGPYDFVGIGVRSIEPGLVPNAPYAGNPSGTLNVLAGGVLTLNYNPAMIGPPTLRPLDNGVVVGNSLNASGTLNVNGGSVTAPMLFAGQADNDRPSIGNVTIANGGSFTAILDSSAQGPLPGFPAVNIGRGLGSVGTISVDGPGSILTAANGALSVGRQGTGTLSVTGGGVVTVGGTVFGSTNSITGSSSIRVEGAGSLLDAGGNDILLGISNNSLDPNDPNHGTATLDVRDAGVVKGELTLGYGGTLRGDGTIVGDVLNLGGTILPGNSPGTLHVDGNLTQSGGTIDIEIAGPALFDTIDVTMNVALSNVLIRFIFTGGYAPSEGDSYGFLQAGGSITNSNPAFEVLGLQPGFVFGVSNLGGVLALDARNDAVAVPEPATPALLAIGLATVLSSRRRRLHRS